MERFVTFVFRQRFLFLALPVLIVLGGSYAWWKLPIDAFPDVTNVQVMILTPAQGFAPEEVERLISMPVEVEMKGLPKVQMIRSLSVSGLSQVVVVFEDAVDTYFARQVVFERLQSARGKIPEGLEPELGPVSTGLGEIYQYTLESEAADLAEIRTVQDWIIRPQLQAVTGVAGINSFGGFVKQYQVVVDPGKLLKYGLTLGQVSEAVAQNNSTAPAGYLVKGAEQVPVRGVGLIRTVPDIESIVVTSHQGTPIFIRDIAEVGIGHETRWGTVTRDAKGETVCGMVIMLKGSNPKEVADDVKAALIQIQKRLPLGIKINPFYDRTELISACIHTVSKALLEGGFLVILVLLLLLGDFRTALTVCLSLPLSALTCFMMMKWTGMTANLMSLGGLVIAQGMIVDASIVVGENIFRRLSDKKEMAEKGRLTICREATCEVTRPVLFAILITIITKFPLFALQAVEGKMFKPLALTLIFALSSSLLISLTIVPVLSSFFIKGSKKEKEQFFIRAIKRIYLPCLNLAIRHKKATAFATLTVFLLSLSLLRFIGTEFLPPLDEGAIAINVVKYPTVSLEESKRIGATLEGLLREFPEAQAVVTKTGRAAIAEDPMGPEQNDIFVMLKPKKFWKASTKTDLIEAMEKRLSQIPGVKLTFSQPIALRVNELISGIKSDVAIKIFGNDLDLLRSKAEEIERAISEIQGAHDVKAEQISGLLQLDIEIDRTAIARHGVSVNEVNEVIETAIGGKTVGTVFEGERRFGLTVRLPEERRNDESTIADILVSTPDGQKVPLGQLARLTIAEVPNQISRENGMRRTVVECNVRGRDIGSFVDEARDKIEPLESSLPSEYYLDWGGQFENQQRAMRTLSVVVPLVILLVFFLLYSAFGSLRPALLVLLNLPFALVGGILAALMFQITLSVSAVVGFITLLGIAVANGTVLVSFFIQLRKSGLPLNQAIVNGCEIRLRPLLLTSLVAILSLTPLLWASGPGAEIQKPLAVVVLGGLISSGFLTLVVLPVLYGWFEKKD